MHLVLICVCFHCTECSWDITIRRKITETSVGLPHVPEVESSRKLNPYHMVHKLNLFQMHGSFLSSWLANYFHQDNCTKERVQCFLPSEMLTSFNEELSHVMTYSSV